MSTLDLTGRVALVTGASRGIGRAVAERLHVAGAAVVLTARGMTEIDPVTLERDRPGSILCIEGSIEDPEFTQHLIKTVFGKYRRLDVLVNNAGFMQPALIELTRPADIERLLQVNLASVLHMTQAAARLMTRTGGSIINVSSIVGVRGAVGQFAYASAKAGVIGATLSAAKELGAKGVRVNAIAPGFIETKMTDDLDAAVRTSTLGRIAMGRAGQPDDVADVALFLASDMSRYVTGQVIGIDGGDGDLMEPHQVLDPDCAGLLPRSFPEGAAALRDDVNGDWITRGTLRAEALAAAAALALPQKGLIFAFVEQRSAAVCALLAAAAAGHAIALVDPTLRADRLAHLVAAYRPDMFFSTRPLADLPVSLVDEGDWRKGSCFGGSLAWAVRGAADSEAIDPDLFLLLSTSGTTGSAKFVRLSFDAVATNARQIASVLGVDEWSVAIAHLPLHYSYGLSVATSHLACGGKVRLMSDAVTSPAFWTNVAEAGGTHFPGVPFHYQVLTRFGLGLVPVSVVTFTQAGGALDLRTQRQMHDQAAARGARFFVMYGQTEAAPRMTTLAHADFETAAGSVGRALPRGRLAVQDLQNPEQELAAGEVGAVTYSGPNVMMGYAQNRADLGRGDEQAGRLETGDLGRLDAEGFLYLTGRLKRFAKVAGLRLGLDEIEGEIAGTAPVACLDGDGRVIVCHESDTDLPIKAKVKELALQYKIPAASFVLRHVSAIPHKDSGKIDYGRLKETAGV